ncbi:globin-like [Ornithodoros turicata]|uniref:Putative hemoglobin-like flavoprotein n=1 Tax=Ornithodoros turicata TaxID=34597 RepID=A0A2R5LN64_9ACAR
MGSVVSNQQDTPDPKTGLTPREKNLVRDTWALVRKDVKSNAVAIFLMLFERHPPYQKLFSGFADVPADQLASDTRLAAHAMSVAYALTALIDNLDDADCLVELVRKTATNHTRRPVTLQHFENLMVVIVDTLKDRLGNKMTPAATSAWEKTLRLVVKVTEDVYKQLGK